MKINKFNDYIRENFQPERGDIVVNLWDDYVDDGYGEQETSIFVEVSNMPQDMKKEVCEIVLDYIQSNYNNPDAKFSIGQAPDHREPYIAINVKDLTHEEMDENLLPLLKSSGLKYKEWPLRFISES